MRQIEAAAAPVGDEGEKLGGVAMIEATKISAAARRGGAASARNALLAAAFSLFALAAAGFAPGPAQAGCCDSIQADNFAEELPDSMRVRFLLPNGRRFAPERLILAGPRAALAADLPERAEPHDEKRLPIGGSSGLRSFFADRPLVDRLSPTSPLGDLYRRGETLVAVFETEGAYQEALWRLRQPVGLVTRAPRGGRLISFSLPLRFAPVDRAQALAQPLGPWVGVAHGAEDVLALTPPRGNLPGFDLF